MANKTKVVVEFLDTKGELVMVYDYADYNKYKCGEIETISKTDAYEKYEVVEEIIDGEIRKFSEDYEDDYDDMCQYMTGADEDDEEDY